MKFSLSSLLLSAASSLVVALPIDDVQVYDAVIVGGGPAGLSVASALGRVRRNTLLIDSGEYRNAPTRHVHDVLGFDGVTPAWYRYSARQQISHYDTVKMTNGTVTKIAGNDTANFVVSATWADGTTKDVRTRKVVLATGLKDDLPNTPGLWENWGKGIFWCPWCDGHEHADQPLGLLSATFDDLPSLVREILTVNTDIIAFANGTDTPAARAETEAKNPKFQEYLDLHNVKIENRTIARINRLKDGGDPPHDPSLPTAPENDLFSVDFVEGGEPVQRGAFFVSFPDEQRSTVGADAGVQLWGGRLAADVSKGLLTNVPGIYAVGDANSDNSTNVPHALYTGKRAAVFLHVKLAKEDQAKETGVDVGSLKREAALDERSIWEYLRSEPDDIFYVRDDQ
ncbi:FAD/NAD(P)-binding domain-containing protein [Colletotrichum zoysiae]|uniref:FAD/NAD(P)-binding domain-containing protein n=1 Tax=Colletotrichum zoysiae TaxID=1216348 RepID=A0AAD9HMC6_9PEZI|nr:FAD/NAD(P)-binding domain-containing protein [Colletotrichum zoysiae]